MFISNIKLIVHPNLEQLHMSVDVDLKGVLECDHKDNSMVFRLCDNSNEF